MFFVIKLFELPVFILVRTFKLNYLIHVSAWGGIGYAKEFR